MNSQYDVMVNEIAQKEGIKNPALELDTTSKKGDGFMGKIEFGRIVGSNKSINVVFKCAHREVKGIGEFIHNVYLNEISFYEVIAPAFKSFQAEYCLSAPYDNYAKLYGSSKEIQNEALCLEDLKATGFHMWDRTKLMNEAHLKCALKTFARYHGTSYAMQRCNPNLYKTLTDNLANNFFMKAFNDVKYYEQMGNIMKKINPLLFSSPQDKHLFTKMAALSENVPADVQKLTQNRDYSVILQGDCWCTNAMYEYDGSDRTKPRSMKMLDFQLINVASPVLDLSYFFYATASSECCNKLEFFLKVYYNAMTEHLAAFGLMIDDVFSFEQFYKHWGDLARFGLYTTIGVRKIMLAEPKDAPDLTTYPVTFMEVMKLTPERDRIYLQQMKDLIIHFEERKFI